MTGALFLKTTAPPVDWTERDGAQSARDGPSHSFWVKVRVILQCALVAKGPCSSLGPVGGNAATRGLEGVPCTSLVLTNTFSGLTESRTKTTLARGGAVSGPLEQRNKRAKRRGGRVVLLHKFTLGQTVQQHNVS